MEALIELLADKGSLTPFEMQLVERSFLLLLALPIVTTVVGIFRHVIGIKTASIYAPIIVTYAFFELGFRGNEYSQLQPDYLRGLQFGLLLYVIVFAASTLLYLSIKRLRMHYIPKSTLVLIGVSLTLMTVVFAGIYIFDREGLVYLDIFTIIMLIALTDNFISTLSRKDIYKTTYVALQTLLVAIISYSIIAIEETQEAIITYGIPILIVLVAINLFVGRYISLRLTEYYRFKDILLQENTSKNVRKNNSDKKKQKESTGTK